MNKSMLVTAIFTILPVLLISSSSSALIPKSTTPVRYQSNNSVIYLNKNDVNIMSNGQGVHIKWVVSKLVNGKAIFLNMTQYSVKRIIGNGQNSVVLFYGNKNLKVAEIYSFANGHIESSIAIKNIEMKNTSYTVAFESTTNYHKTISLNGFSGGTREFPGNSITNICPLNHNTWSYNDQFTTISWKSEISIFHVGYLEVNATQNKLILPFGPFTLARNSTYSIDPSITPDKFVGGGGGSSGGGGSTSSKPSITFEPITGLSSTDNTFRNGHHTLGISVNVTSMGGTSSVKLDFYAIQDQLGTYTSYLLYSTTADRTGPYGFNWNVGPPGYYSAFKWTAKNSVGTSTATFTATPVRVYTDFVNQNQSTGDWYYPMDSMTSEPIYSATSGVPIGYMTLQIRPPFDQPIDGSDYNIQFATSFLKEQQSSSYCVNYYSQSFAWIGNSMGDSAKSNPNYVNNAVNDLYYQYNQNGTWDQGGKIWSLFEAILATIGFLGFPGDVITSIISPFFEWLVQSSSLPQSGDNLTLTEFGGMDANSSAGNLHYLPIRSYPGGIFGNAKNSFLFDFKDTFNFAVPVTSATSTDAALDYFYYYANYGITTTSTNGYWAGSIAEPICIANY